VAAAIAEALAIGGDRSPYFEAVLLYLNLELMIERGQLADADAEGERLAQLQVSWSPVATLFATCTRGRLRIAQGRYEEALADLMRIPAETRVDNPAALPWRSHASLALARLGRTDDALELMERELELARRFALPRSIGVVLRAAAALHRGDHAIDLLRESVDALGACPSDLERSHSLMELGSALRRSGRRRDAIAPLRDALELAERCDATALVERGRRELTDAGSRPHRPAHAGRDGLTPSELRIAQLASEGMANKEIAQSLFVSLRTVETHLTNAYRKLGISARAQLTTALADRASAG
jgi:DNA-binding NarL/FixJ family response regulator